MPRRGGTRAAAQIKAFEDTWHWDQTAEESHRDIVEQGGKVSEAMQAFRQLLGTSDMMAYLAMMAPRLAEMHRTLKPTGSIYLHCDPTASHYLKLLMDAIFGAGNFRNEIIWKRTSAHSSANRFGSVHDVLLYYVRSDKAVWFPQSMPHSEKYLASKYRYTDEQGVYRLADITGAGRTQGPSGQPWRGFDVAAKGRHWIRTPDELELLNDRGKIYWPKDQGMPAYKKYLVEGAGRPLQDVWDDIPPVNSMAHERLGYPTQKPEALLERIIDASTKAGGLILDPFCGCGTAIAVAQRLDRQWIGIDITHLAINLIKTRLLDAYGESAIPPVTGEPTTVDGAEDLAKSDPYQFQWWALGLVGARPAEQKKGADKGVDGRLYFHDDHSGKTRQVILSVKAGHTSVPHVRDLRGVIDREKAVIGVLITFQQSTQPMRSEAASAGFYESAGWGKKYPRLQIFTVGELLQGKTIDMPPLRQVNRTFKKAPRVISRDTGQAPLSLVADESESYDFDVEPYS